MAKIGDVFIPCMIKCRMEPIQRDKKKSNSQEGKEDGNKRSPQRGKLIKEAREV